MAELGIVIVTHNSAAHIGECLRAARASGADVIVIDNASTDETLKEVSQANARVIANPQNLGFAAGVNQGIRALDAPYLLLLNPDAILLSGLEPLHACCDRPQAAGAGGKLLDARGAPQVGFMFRRFPTPGVMIFEALGLNFLWPRNPVNRQYRCLGSDYGVEQAVDQPAGAFLMLRRDVWQAIGGFDETFHPLWFEDVDFARRAAARGYRMYYTPLAVAKHTGAHSISNVPLEIRLYYWYGSCLRYAARHFRPWSTRAVCLAIMAGSLVRLVTRSITQHSLRPVVAWGGILRLVSRCITSAPK